MAGYGIIVAMFVAGISMPLAKSHDVFVSFDRGCLAFPKHAGPIHGFLVENQLVENGVRVGVRGPFLGGKQISHELGGGRAPTTWGCIFVDCFVHPGFLVQLWSGIGIRVVCAFGASPIVGT
jgi:hypothetical protein